jgi:hypothetical protein
LFHYNFLIYDTCYKFFAFAICSITSVLILCGSVHPREIINAVGDGLLNIAISYAERSGSYPAEEIAEGFVSHTSQEHDRVPSQGMYHVLSNAFIFY